MLFSKRLTLGGITSTFTKTLADLEALQAQNKADVAKHEAEIAAKQATVASLNTEADGAAAIHSNISKLLSKA